MTHFEVTAVVFWSFKEFNSGGFFQECGPKVLQIGSNDAF